jgi:polyisoprenyl-phosphate glycosyltransferase
MTTSPLRLTVVMPVYDDWTAAEIVCSLLDDVFSTRLDLEVAIILINDGSVERHNGMSACAMRSLRSISVLHLKRNIGHQRAIAIGLAFTYEKLDSEAFLIMDSDGEDRANDALRLIDKFLELNAASSVFAARRKRFEGSLFKLGYSLYRHLHWLLTGIKVEIGNFSVLSRVHLAGLTVSSELWSHYAAAVVRTRIPVTTIPADRGRRLAGRSKMNYVSLVSHGLSAISVFREFPAARLLVASAAAVIFFTVLLIATVCVRLFTNLAIPGWATQSAGILCILILQVVTISFAVAFLINRDQASFIPIRDYSYFVGNLEKLR